MTLSQTEAIIYLAEKREGVENKDFRSLKTIPKLNAIEGSIQHYCPVKAINDNTLAAGKKQEITSGNTHYLLILPLVGALKVHSTEGVSVIVPGAAHYEFLNKNNTISISNPYEDALVNYLEIHIDNHFPIQQTESLTYYFDLDTTKNTMHPLLEMEQQHNSKPFKSPGWIGQYDGRKEDVVKVRNAQSSLFVYVINGVFEMQNRLLQPRDGLFLSNLDEAEFEALANNSILLCF